MSLSNNSNTGDNKNKFYKHTLNGMQKRFFSRSSDMFYETGLSEADELDDYLIEEDEFEDDSYDWEDI
ncbi:MAG: hypothetical protein E7515_00580 [Ruminococcaceae bacterium]|nr:hypothetical protein [Oscillospiraceae bacterium]